LPFLEGHALPAVDRGLAKAGRRREDFLLQVNAMVITGETDEAIKVATKSIKDLLGFYATTPAYRPPMEAVGYGDLQPKLNKLSKDGKWDELASYIDDDFVEAFTTAGRPEEIADKLKEKYGAYADRLAIYAPYGAPDAMWKKIIEDLKREQRQRDFRAGEKLQEKGVKVATWPLAWPIGNPVCRWGSV
jgi:alkanesulfonate monooxygenase SsuD/methylene tetrahydromethanopterin reductase-like flavin-dependent oxidoreductase (luciferase family)